MSDQAALPLSVSDRGVTILLGDVRDMLRTMPADSVDCVVTSPPYWGLRDYGVAGQIGLEPTLGEHIDVMVDVFREVRRVMKPTATLWLNLGDCFATTPNGRSATDAKAQSSDDRTFRDKPFSTVGAIETRRNGGEGQHHARREGVLKQGDLAMVPNRIAIALQDDGWWVKQENVWGKTNPMPDSSGAYRPSSAHEKIFMLAKGNVCELWRARDTGELSASPDLSEQCPLITKPDELAPRWIRMPFWYDACAVRREASEASEARWRQDIENQAGSARAVGKTNGAMKAVGGRTFRANQNANGFRGGSYVNGKPGPRTQTGNIPGTGDRFLRNYEPAPLNVWPMATEAFKEAHFATFPQELAERCILAGCPPGGHVLDPFGGSGTVGFVADRMGRRATLIELNPDYVALIKRRLAQQFVYMGEKTTTPAAGLPMFEQLGEW